MGSAATGSVMALIPRWQERGQELLAVEHPMIVYTIPPSTTDPAGRSRSVSSG